MAMQAQLFIEEFDTDATEITYTNGFAGSFADGEWTIVGDGSTGQYETFGYNFVDADGNPMTLDITENNKIFVRVKSSKTPTHLRMDVKDADGYQSTEPAVSVFSVTSAYSVVEFDYTGTYSDGGYGGTSCEPGTGPCPVDGSRITELVFYLDSNVPGGFAGTAVIDFISVGSEPSVGPMSDIFQDEFDNPNSLGYMGTAGSLVNSVEDGIWTISGDGTNGPWEPVNLLTYNTTSGDTVDISVADGNDKVYIRARSAVEGTSIRLDLMDINEFATTVAPPVKILTDEWATYEFNFAGIYQDNAFGGTGCLPVGGDPCPVDPERIFNMILFVNPGVEAFVGEVEIEYISVGTSLEPVDPNANVLEYGDHFGEASGSFVSTTGAFDLNVENSLLTITGNGGDGPFTTVSVAPYDSDGAILVDATNNNKVFLRARSDAPNTLLRVDLLDSASYVTSAASFTRLLTDEFEVYEIDFTGNYIDGGFGGEPCVMGPCPVNGEIISNILLYPNPADGGFEGNIEIDYISFGAPMGEDVQKYSDQFEDGDRSQWSDAGGFAIEEIDGELIITGDGTAGAYSAFNYTPHDQETFEPLTLDMTSNNKLYMKVKASVPTSIRVDLVDELGYATTEPATVAFVSEDYQVLEWDFEGTYSDGGYGGTSCEPGTGPCPVDGTVVTDFLVYIDADNGGYNGVVTIDWFSTIDPLETIVDPGGGGPTGLEAYSDEFTANDAAVWTSDNYAINLAEGEVTATGDGSAGQYSTLTYQLNDGGDSVAVDAVINDDKIFIRAKSTGTATILRMDLIDSKGFHTSGAGLTANLTAEYDVYEYNFAGAYTDGGFGGTACEPGTGPCPVDGERVSFLNFYPDPDIGGFAGDITIDWVSFGEPLMVNVVDYDIASGGKLYPNPVAHELYLDIATVQSGNMVVEFTDLLGQVHSSQSFGQVAAGNNTFTLQTADIAQGMYVVSILVDGRQAFTAKVIVQ